MLDGDTYLAGLVTDRDFRIAPLRKTNGVLSEPLPLTKEVSDELNLSFADFLKEKKFYGGVYLSQYLDQLKFMPGQRASGGSYIFNVDSEEGPASFRIGP
jgi:hypothetical protein